MKIDVHIKYWLNSADHDLETAESLLSAEKFDWCLFLGHLVLEKALKAFYVKDNDNRMPPKIHNLVKLAEKSTIPLDEGAKLFLDEINDFNLEVRYPEYRQEFYKSCTKQFAEEYFAKIKEYYKWIKSQLKSVGS